MAKNGWAGPDDAEISTAMTRAEKKLSELYPGCTLEVTPRTALELKGRHRAPLFAVGVVIVRTVTGATHAYRVSWDVQAFSGKLVKIGSM